MFSWFEMQAQGSERVQEEQNGNFKNISYYAAA